MKDHDGEPRMGDIASHVVNASSECYFGVLKRDIRHAVRNLGNDYAKAFINICVVNLHNPLRRRGIRRRFQ